MKGLAHVLPNELRGRNITVNAITRGRVATKLFPDGKAAEQISGSKLAHATATRWQAMAGSPVKEAYSTRPRRVREALRDTRFSVRDRACSNRC